MMAHHCVMSLFVVADVGFVGSEATRREHERARRESRREELGRVIGACALFRFATPAFEFCRLASCETRDASEAYLRDLRFLVAIPVSLSRRFVPPFS